MSKWILTILFLGSVAGADGAYIKEVQGLIDTLMSKDPVRVTLTLRLADAQFEDYLKLSNGGGANHETESLRHTIIKNYLDALSGFDGLFPQPAGSLKGKVQFQLARLYNDDGKVSDAETLWQGLINQDILVDLKRESALRVAENYEGRSDFKGAETLYLMALKLCAGGDVCSYTHYRLGWVYHHEDRINDAVTEIKLSLWDSKGQIREEALKDYITFMALVPGDGKETLAEIETLTQKIQRPQLIHDLSDALFASGQRAAGVYVLENYNKKNPQLKNYARLLEEQYGFRNWAAFNNTLDDLTTFVSNKETIKDASKDQETEKILRRLTVQLDGERVTQSFLSADFKKTVLLYLTIYNFNLMRSQMIDGWLVAETDSNQKIDKLMTWAAEEKSAGHTGDEIRLREKRAAEAQKIHRLEVVQDEMSVLKVIEPSEKKKRENAYQEAHAAYELKNYDRALPLFQELALVKTTPDQWAIQSENLSLDIMAQKKDFKGLLSQVNLYLNHPDFEKWVQATPSKASDLRDLKKISLQAQFEQATSLGESTEALKVFKDFCQEKLFLPGSCENARVLAIKLRDQETLLEILKRQNKFDELISEEEAAGYYFEAASMLEPSLKTKGATNRDFIKVALLYELGQKNVERDRVLNGLVARISKNVSMGEDEDLIYVTLKDAKLLSAHFLKFQWKKENRTKLIGDLELTGLGTAITHKVLEASCENMGPAWVKMAFDHIKDLDTHQRSIKFYGKNSTKKFELRLAWLKKMTTAGDCYLQGADAKSRVIMSTALAQSEFDLSEEIKLTPIPEGLDATSQDQVKATLAQMAEPFNSKGKDFSRIASEQLEKIESLNERMALKEKLELHTPLDPPNFISEKALPNNQGESVVLAAVQNLHKDSNEFNSIETLKKYYESQGKMRLAAYYEGRLLEINKGKSGEGQK